MKKEIQELAEKIRLIHPEYSAKEIADFIRSEYPEVAEAVSDRTLYDYCKLSSHSKSSSSTKAQQEEPKESHWWDNHQAFEEEKRTRNLELVPSPSKHNAWMDWDATPPQYIFELWGGVHPLPIFDIPFDQVQALIEAYTYSGKAMTQAQCARMMYERFNRKLTHDYLKMVLQALGVDKNSTPFAPHRFKTHSHEENAENWREKQESELEIFERATAAEHWRKRALKLRQDIFKVETYLSSLPFVDVQVNVSPIAEVIPVDPSREFQPIITLADWHGGKWVGLDYNQFDTEILNERIAAFETQIVEQIYQFAQLGTVLPPIWFVLGDMLDGPMGDMHAQQGIHQDSHNDEQVEFVHLLLLSCIRRIEGNIANLVKPSDKKRVVGAVPGNHGRSTRLRQDDPVRVIERVLYKWTASHLPSHEWILPEPATDRYINYVDKEKQFQITVWHGDEGPKDWRSILFHHRNLAAKDHLLIHGHWHRFEYNEDRHGVCVGVGSPVGIEDYGHNQFAGGGRPQQLLIIHEEGRGFYVPGQIIL